jgi:hypothetical protein
LQAVKRFHQEIIPFVLLHHPHFVELNRDGVFKC